MDNREKENYEALQRVAEDTAKKTGGFLKKAFDDMAESAKAQHEVSKAQFEAVKAESKANFEENRFHNTFAKAKADAKEHWDNARMTPQQRKEAMENEHKKQLADARERIKNAQDRIEAAKK